MDWFPLSLIALVFFGIQKFLFKVVAEKGCSMMQTTGYFMGTVTVLAFCSFFVVDGNVENWRTLMVIAVLNGTVFLILTLSRMKALKYLPGTIAYPLFQFSLVLVTLFGLFYFHDNLNLYQAIGAVMGTIATLFLARAKGETETQRRTYKLGLLLVLVAVVAGALSEIISKFAAISSSDILLFIGISYAWNFLASGSYALLPMVRSKANPQWKTAAKYGILIGITNFIAFYAELSAFRTGPLSLVAVLSSFSTLVAMGLAAWIYRERLDWKGTLGAGLAVVSIILLGIRT